ncbi:MAG: hypothetical protein NVS9B15_04060 [Acidobacteriaceae bacterium]
MAPLYWILLGLIGGFFTGKLMRFHTVNWHGAVDAVIGIVGAVTGAAVFRGFGWFHGDHADWKVVLVAALSGVVATFVVNDLARTREEEVEEHVVAEHHPEYSKLERSWEERLLHVNGDPMAGGLDSDTDSRRVAGDTTTVREGKRPA